MDSVRSGPSLFVLPHMMRTAPIPQPDAGPGSGPFPCPATIVEQLMSATQPPYYGIAAVITDGTLRAFCTVCPWWSRDVGRSVFTDHRSAEHGQSSYVRARAELTSHILTPAHAARRVDNGS